MRKKRMASVTNLEAVHDWRARKDEPLRTPHTMETLGGLGLMVLYFMTLIQNAVVLIKCNLIILIMVYINKFVMISINYD